MEMTSQEMDMPTCFKIIKYPWLEEIEWKPLCFALQKDKTQLYLPDLDTCMDNPLDYNISHCPEEEVSNTKHGEPLKGEEQVD